MNCQTTPKVQNKVLRDQTTHKVKEESDNHVSTTYQPMRNADEYDLKPSILAIYPERDMDASVKQECERLAADNIDLKDDTINPLAIQMTKKRGIACGKTGMEHEVEPMKLSAEILHKPGASPARKKATAAGDKQPTLFSYFGKG